MRRLLRAHFCERCVLCQVVVAECPCPARHKPARPTMCQMCLTGTRVEPTRAPVLTRALGADTILTLPHRDGWLIVGGPADGVFFSQTELEFSRRSPGEFADMIYRKMGARRS